MLQDLYRSYRQVGLSINVSKFQFITKLVPSTGKSVVNVHLEQVTSWKYLSHDITIGRDNKTREIARRIGPTWAAFGK